MSSLPRRRRIKLPTIIVKRSQIAKNDLFNKGSYRPLYENVKANNNALAKALSNEKQQRKYLYTQNIELTSQLHELGVACNRRDYIISGVLKNAKETLQLMVTLSSYVTNTIASCQQVVTTTRYTPRKSTNNRRDSTRRSSGKLPARGVEQPMVSGHTITKPTINLSRLNIQREYREQNLPNLSDIEEVLTPTQSPVAAELTSSVRVPIARSLDYGTGRVDRLPERSQGSIVASDENERRSSARSNRNSNRHSARRSRGSPERLSEDQTPRRSTSEMQASERLESPRVALHDVSRLLQNSQSVNNIRTSLENSSDMDMTQPSQIADLVLETQSTNVSPPESEGIIAESSEEPESDVNVTVAVPEPSKSKNSSDMDMTQPSQIADLVLETQSTNVSPPESEGIIAESSEEPESDVNVTVAVPEPSKSKLSSKKAKTSLPSDMEEDPLEGPSWLLNGTGNASFSTEDEVSTTVNNSTRHQNTKDHAKSTKPAFSETEEEEKEEEKEEEEEKRAEAGQRDERTVNLATRYPKDQINFYDDMHNEDDRTAATNLAPFVTRERGNFYNDDDDDDDSWTLLWKRPEASRNYDYDYNELVLPVLDNPLIAAVEPPIPDPEPTTNIQRINQTFATSFTPAFPRANVEETFLDDTGPMLPRLTEKLDTPRAASALVKQEEQSDEEDVVPRKRKRQYKKKAVVDSASDSDLIPTPKRTNDKLKRKNSKTKDPSSAKVLQKLNETHVKERSPSPEARFSAGSERQRRSSSMSLQRDGSSDLEGSNASSTAKSAPSRPRRQSAPKNLQEPSFGKKMKKN